MRRMLIGGVIGGLMLVAGCQESAPPTADPVPQAKADSDASPDEPAIDDVTAADPFVASTGPDGEEKAPDEGEFDAAADEPFELKLEGVRFWVPAGWEKVKPQSNIIEAEFELPRASGDEYDGRLTLMSSGGNPDETIANRTAEFNQDPGHGPTIEALAIDGVEAKWIDLRGEWKGQSFQRIEPRPDYRMLLVIIPFSERSAFYAKLTGPRETVAAHEEAFRAFLQSARLTVRSPQN